MISYHELLLTSNEYVAMPWKIAVSSRALSHLANQENSPNTFIQICFSLNKYICQFGQIQVVVCVGLRYWCRALIRPANQVRERKRNKLLSFSIRAHTSSSNKSLTRNTSILFSRDYYSSLKRTRKETKSSQCVQCLKCSLIIPAKECNYHKKKKINT